MSPLPKTALGQTGIEVSRLGLGTVKFGRNQGVKYPKGFELPDMPFLANLLALAKDLGINMLDTAPAYGLSEERLGTLLAGQREDWVIVGKVGEEFEQGQSTHDFSKAHFKTSIERSLKRLGTDYIDVMLIHSDGSDMDILTQTDCVEALQELKAAGTLRAIGASTKTVDGGIETLKQMDVVMACYNPAYTDEKPVLDYAQAHGGGVLLKKALASGHLNQLGADRDPVKAAMQFAFNHSAAHSLILGTINPDHLKQNVNACLQALQQLAEEPLSL